MGTLCSRSKDPITHLAVPPELIIPHNVDVHNLHVYRVRQLQNFFRFIPGYDERFYIVPARANFVVTKSGCTVIDYAETQQPLKVLLEVRDVCNACRVAFTTEQVHDLFGNNRNPYPTHSFARTITTSRSNQNNPYQHAFKPVEEESDTESQASK